MIANTMNCCVDWGKAQLEGTDNEGYQSLLSYYKKEDSFNVPVDGWYIGSNLQPIRFCPWCGKPVPNEKAL